MKIVAIIVSLLAVANHAFALDCQVPGYTDGFIISKLCSTEKDTKVLWPDYADATRYYRCQGLNNAVQEDCFPNTIFSFSQQSCTKCDKYIPAPPCTSLTVKANCVALPATTPAPITTTTTMFCNLKVYTSTFKPTCLGNDVYRLWPNYANAKQYYKCQGPYNAQIKTCPPNTYFNYYAQYCTDCSELVEAPACETLISQADKSNKCEKIK